MCVCQGLQAGRGCTRQARGAAGRTPGARSSRDSRRAAGTSPRVLQAAQEGHRAARRAPLRLVHEARLKLLDRCLLAEVRVDRQLAHVRAQRVEVALRTTQIGIIAGWDRGPSTPFHALALLLGGKGRGGLRVGGPMPRGASAAACPPPRLQERQAPSSRALAGALHSRLADVRAPTNSKLDACLQSDACLQAQAALTLKRCRQ